MSGAGSRRVGWAVVGFLLAGVLAAVLWWVVFPQPTTASPSVLEPWPDHVRVEAVEHRPCSSEPGAVSTFAVVDVDTADGDGIDLLRAHLEAQGFAVRVPAGPTARTWADGIASGHDMTVWFGDADSLDERADHRFVEEEAASLRMAIDRLPPPRHHRVVLLLVPGRCIG